jgi:hypothetical protein
VYSAEALSAATSAGLRPSQAVQRERSNPSLCCTPGDLVIIAGFHIDGLRDAEGV